MTDKQDKIKSLAWKYFIQQKAFEISRVIVYCCAGALIIMGVGIFCCFIEKYPDPACIILGIICIFYLVREIFITIKNWLMSNWTTAMNRAEDEIK